LELRSGIRQPVGRQRIPCGGRVIFHILAAIAEFETEAAVHQAQAMYDSGQYTVEQIAAAFKTSRPTIYRALDPDTVGKKPTSPAKTRRAVASMVDSGAQLDDGL
jgi:DNA invertase Pin-like site-specific DNA recombinase